MRPANAIKGHKGFACIPLAKRIEAKIERIPFSTCWYWIGATNSHGYGQVWLNKKSRLVHEFLYEEKFGEVPTGKELNHLCEIKYCCNPACLEAVTHAENLLYLFKRRKERAKHGR